MNRNLKNIINIFLFVLTFAVFLSFMSLLLKPKDVFYDNIVDYYGEKKNSIDVLYIGGSACLEYFQPVRAYREYGFTSYNYACASVQAESYEYMIKEALKTQSPELLLIDARAFEYRGFYKKSDLHVGYHNSMDGISMLSANKYDFIFRYVNGEELDSKLNYILPFVHYHAAGYINPVDAVKRLLRINAQASKGWHASYETRPQTREDFMTDEIGSLPPESEEILQSLLDYLDGLDVKVLFVVSPYIEVKDHRKIFNYVKQEVNKRGYDFLDSNEYYDEIGLDFEKDFFDYNHVNVPGSEKYTDFLAEYLSRNYDLKDHRSDSGYQEWNEAQS